MWRWRQIAEKKFSRQISLRRDSSVEASTTVTALPQGVSSEMGGRRSGVNAALNSWTFREQRVKKGKTKRLICFLPISQSKREAMFRIGVFHSITLWLFDKHCGFRLFGRPKEQIKKKKTLIKDVNPIGLLTFHQHNFLVLKMNL